MNELAQQIPPFERDASQLAIALSSAEQVEQLLLQTMDFLVLLVDGEVITAEQITSRDALLTRACQLLPPVATKDSVCIVSK